MSGDVMLAGAIVFFAGVAAGVVWCAALAPLIKQEHEQAWWDERRQEWCELPDPSTELVKSPVWNERVGLRLFLATSRLCGTKR